MQLAPPRGVRRGPQNRRRAEARAPSRAVRVFRMSTASPRPSPVSCPESPLLPPVSALGSVHRRGAFPLLLLGTCQCWAHPLVPKASTGTKPTSGFREGRARTGEPCWVRARGGFLKRRLFGFLSNSRSCCVTDSRLPQISQAHKARLTLPLREGCHPMKDGRRRWQPSGHPTQHGAMGSCEPAFSERLKVNRHSANSSYRAPAMCRALSYALEGRGGERHPATGWESNAKAPREEGARRVREAARTGEAEGLRCGRRPTPRLGGERRGIPSPAGCCSCCGHKVSLRDAGPAQPCDTGC